MERIVQCLSPVHIGTGKDLEPFDYIVDGQRYIRVHLDAVLERMTPEQADALATWVSKQADQMVELGRNQSDAVRREMQLSNFPGADAALREALRTDAALARYYGDRGFERNLQVREQIKSADDTPLIPGSSLKGALRTALAFAALEEMKQEERQALGQSLERRLNARGSRLKERIGQEIEQAIFRCGKQPEDIQYDLMRAVSISDTYDAQAELIVPQIYTFVEQRTRNGNTCLDAQAPLIAETHAPGNTFRLRLRVDGDLLRAIRRNSRRGKWINFEQRVQRAFGPEVVRLLSDASNEQIEQAVINRLGEAARRFAKAIVGAEQRWEVKHGHGSTRDLKDFYTRLDGLIRKGQVPLRLGWGSHFMATTLLLALKEDAGWRPIIERCFQAFDIGVPPRRHRDRGGGAERQIDLDDFPRSRRLVAASKKPVAPLGWIALAPAKKDLPDEPLTTKEQLLRRPQERRREGRGPSRTYIQPAKSSPLPQSGPRANDRVMAELLAEKTKKGRWKAKHVDSGLEGPIQDDVPADAEPGQRVELTVAAISSTEMQFRWAPPAPKKTPDQSGRSEYRGKRRGEYR